MPITGTAIRAISHDNTFQRIAAITIVAIIFNIFCPLIRTHPFII